MKQSNIYILLIISCFFYIDTIAVTTSQLLKSLTLPEFFHITKKPVLRLPPNTLELDLTIDGDTGDNVAINNKIGSTALFDITTTTITLQKVTNNFTKRGAVPVVNNNSSGINISNFTIKTTILNATGTVSTLDATFKIDIYDVMGYFSTSSSSPDTGYISVINGFGYGIVKSSTTASYAVVKVNGTSVTITITTNALFYVLICNNFFPTNPVFIKVTSLTNAGKYLANYTPQGQTIQTLPFDTTVTVTVAFVNLTGIPSVCDGAFYVFIADSLTPSNSNLTEVTPNYSNATRTFTYVNKLYSAPGNTTTTLPVTLTAGVFTNKTPNSQGIIDPSVLTIVSTVPLQAQSASPLTSTITNITPGSFFINAILAQQ